MSERFTESPLTQERLSQEPSAFEERIRRERYFLSPRPAFGEKLLELERMIATSGGLVPPKFYERQEKEVRFVTSKLLRLIDRRHPEDLKKLVWLVSPFMDRPNAVRLLEQATGRNVFAFRRTPDDDPAFGMFVSHLAAKGRDAFQDEGAQQLIADLVRAHIERIHQVSKRLQAQQPEFIQETQDRFDVLRRRGLVPLSSEFIQRRLAFARLYAADPVENAFDRFGGGYDADTHDILLDPRHPERFQKIVYGHEAIRALQGRSEVSVTSDEGEPETVITREGLTFFAISDPSRGRFSWLSEAVEDRLAEHVFGRDRGSRSGARLIEVLGMVGVDEKLLFSAYFEQDRPSTDGDKGANPSVRQVFQLANEVLGSRALVEIDRLMTVALDAGERASVVLDGVSDVLESDPKQLTAFIQKEKALFAAAAGDTRGDA